jgi:hypothetical protein
MARLTVSLGLCCLAVTLGGCSSSSTRSTDLSADEEAIVHVGLAYREASTALKRAPKGIEELKPYLKKYGDPDQVLISPNDGKRYHIVWGAVATRPTKAAQAQRFLAYEEVGKDGTRLAVDFKMNVYHLSDEEFKRIQASN